MKVRWLPARHAERARQAGDIPYWQLCQSCQHFYRPDIRSIRCKLINKFTTIAAWCDHWAAPWDQQTGG